MIIQNKKTKVTKANTKSDSLRTSIPKQIVQALNLTDGDSVDWRLNLINGEIVITVVKDNWYYG